MRDGIKSVQQDEASATLLLDENIYCREAVLLASDWFTDRCYVSISRPGPGKLAVAIKSKTSRTELEPLLSEFQNALLDFQLRVEIGRETKQIRELIVAKAFAEGDLLDDAPVGDWHDPVGARK